MLLRVFYFLFFLLLMNLPDLIAQDTGDGKFLKFSGSHTSRSADGRFLLEGSNAVQNLELGVWAEEVAAKVERAIAVRLPYGESWVIRIVTTDDRSLGDSGKIITEEVVEGQFLVLRLKIYNYNKTDVLEANEALCKLLLDGLVIWLQSKQNAADSSQAPVGFHTNSVPEWIWQGLSRYIYQDLRARDADTVLMLWKRAQLKPFPELLILGPAAKNYPSKSVYSVIIAWIESLPDRENLFRRMFEDLSKRGKISQAWFTKNITGCRYAADVDEKWENWILSQWRVVHRLGIATALQVEQLKERLVLRHGDIGMPLSPDIGQRITFENLIGAKQPDWMPTVLKNKISELKLLGVGKGKDFNDVVDAYGRFLEAVVAGARQERQVSLLERAEEEFKRLEASVGGASLTVEDNK
ncbi:MAG: hypothetical protein A2283_00695 [Lentisphaerae bacterium RIFOXYA12_FULL_48_11]|nr:MAG: hypothetical protein A2283_00695 [Lentisphaerae bacterium RIFOXYA12_FULL_48_11]